MTDALDPRAGPTRTLIAGFGNELRGDDGFGIHVIRRLRDAGVGDGSVDLMEVGTAGLRLAQQLLDPYDRLIIVDAIGRGGAPGTVHVLAVDSVETATDVDMHTAVPARALAVAKALGGLPRDVWIVGCEPAEVDELTASLSPSAAAAVSEVVRRIRDLCSDGASTSRGRSVDLERRDEVLQVMFWLTAEGLGPDVAATDIARFVGDVRAVAAVLAHLVERGYAEPYGVAGGVRYRLTSVGEVEGRRRFLDEFEPYLARSAHGECGSPDCDCHAGGECRSA